MENRYGIWYIICRVLLGILIVLSFIATIVWIIAITKWSAGLVIGIIISLLVNFIGIVAVWREHFLFACIYTVVYVISVIINVSVMFTVGSLVVGILLVLVAVAYTAMLYSSGQRDMNMPQLCCV